MDLKKVYEVLELQDEVSAEELISKYRKMKAEYTVIKDTTPDLKTRLLYQMRLIELDDAYLYFIKHHL